MTYIKSILFWYPLIWSSICRKYFEGHLGTQVNRGYILWNKMIILFPAPNVSLRLINQSFQIFHIWCKWETYPSFCLSSFFSVYTVVCRCFNGTYLEIPSQYMLIPLSGIPPPDLVKYNYLNCQKVIIFQFNTLCFWITMHVG